MLTQSARRKLETLLNQLNIANERVTINSLEGFLYAVAIIPDIIMPSEWLPVMFGGEMPEVADKQQASMLMTALMNAYNHFNTLRLDGDLHFPYTESELSEATFNPILEWCYGFQQGLMLRRGIWMSPMMTMNSGEKIGPVANSVSLIRALVEGDMDAIESLEEIKAALPEGLADEEFKAGVEACLLISLPAAVKNIQLFGKMLDKRRQETARPPQPIPTRKVGPSPRQPMRTKKVGRNEPCPCGSGKKYKKCCGGDYKGATLH